MTLKLEIFSTGPMENNSFVLFDDKAKQAFIFDPSFESQPLLDFIIEKKLLVETILITHGHFDHFAGVAFVRANLPNRPKIALHPADLDLWREGGGSKQFRVLIDLPESPDISLSDGQMLNLGNGQIETRSAPGHSPGSVVFYIPELQTAVCGDVIFHHGIGRTDLADGNFDLLMTSIRTKIFTLPPKTRLIPGHGIETTVEEEKLHNPFINFSPK